MVNSYFEFLTDNLPLLLNYLESDSSLCHMLFDLIHDENIASINLIENNVDRPTTPQ